MQRQWTLTAAAAVGCVVALLAGHQTLIALLLLLLL
jgi:hypothetical protein